MPIRKFFRKIIAMTISYITIIVIVNILYAFAGLFIQKQLAIGQMQSADESYAVFLIFSALLRHRGTINFFIWCVFTGFIAREIHKYNKKVKGESQK